MQRLKTTGNYEKTAALAKANLDTLLVALGAGKNSVETNSKTKKENLFSTIKLLIKKVGYVKAYSFIRGTGLVNSQPVFVGKLNHKRSSLEYVKPKVANNA